MDSITPNELDFIYKIVESRSPENVGLIAKIAQDHLVQSEKDTLQEILVNEMVENGLGANDEPNEIGRSIDSIIGRLPAG